MKTFLFLLLLLSAGWALAQNEPKPRQANPSSDHETTVQGCLNGAHGEYNLTDSSHHTYQLAGDTSKLSELVGHKVELTGTMSRSHGGTATSPGSAGIQTLDVSSVKDVSSSCNLSSSH